MGRAPPRRWAFADHRTCPMAWRRVSPERRLLLFSFDGGGNRDVHVFPIMAHSWPMAGPLSFMPPPRRGRGGLRREGVWDRDRRGHAWAAGPASPRHRHLRLGLLRTESRLQG